LAVGVIVLRNISGENQIMKEPANAANGSNQRKRMRYARGM